MSASPLTPHPDWQALIEERQALRIQIANVFTKLHTLEDSHSIILTHYATAFGVLLIMLHQAEIEAARVKREIELVQSSINRGAELDYEMIVSQLDSEFAQWQKKLEIEAAEMNAYHGLPVMILDAESARKLDVIFRKLVRKLHPDLYPNQSEEEKDLWHQLTKAYDHSDLERLEALSVLVQNKQTEEALPDSMGELSKAIAQLRDRLESMQQRLKELKACWPYNQGSLLANLDAVKARQKDLARRISEQDKLLEDRQNILNRILGH